LDGSLVIRFVRFAASSNFASRLQRRSSEFLDRVSHGGRDQALRSSEDSTSSELRLTIMPASSSSAGIAV